MKIFLLYFLHRGQHLLKFQQNRKACLMLGTIENPIEVECGTVSLIIKPKLETKMKKLFNTDKVCKTKTNDAILTRQNASFFYLSVLLSAFLFTGCQKLDIKDLFKGKDEAHDNMDVVKKYSGLSPQTVCELQQARSATARYRNIKNAIADGYTNIEVDVENMGHHYMKKELVDGKFDISKPEILVYHENEDGRMELGAVEYAVPISEPEPQGFTGSGDKWDHNTTFQLWLLHAWVWTYNPDGVFNPLNPLVHLH
jgi:hypothetical protein